MFLCYQLGLDVVGGEDADSAAVCASSPPTRLIAISDGDIFFAKGELTGLLCLVMQCDDAVVAARRCTAADDDLLLRPA